MIYWWRMDQVVWIVYMYTCALHVYICKEGEYFTIAVYRQMWHHMTCVLTTLSEDTPSNWNNACKCLYFLLYENMSEQLVPYDVQNALSNKVWCLLHWYMSMSDVCPELHGNFNLLVCLEIFPPAPAAWLYHSALFHHVHWANLTSQWKMGMLVHI
jgi:hypothetical protein